MDKKIEIKILSRNLAEEFIAINRGESIEIISITDPHSNIPVSLGSLASRALYLQFEDIDDEHEAGCISRKDANKIANFVKTIKKKQQYC